MIHEINITQEMIDSSECGSVETCIIAKALQVLYPDSTIYTYFLNSIIYEFKYTKHIHSEKVTSYIRVFDRHKNVKPCILLVDDEQLTLDIKYDS